MKHIEINNNYHLPQNDNINVIRRFDSFQIINIESNINIIFLKLSDDFFNIENTINLYDSRTYIIRKEDDKFTINKNIAIGKYNMYSDNVCTNLIDIIYIVFNPFKEIKFHNKINTDEFIKEYVLSTHIKNIKNNPIQQVLNSKKIIDSYDDFDNDWDLKQYDYDVYETNFYFINQLIYEERLSMMSISKHITSYTSIFSEKNSDNKNNKNFCNKNGSKYTIDKFYYKINKEKYYQCWVYAYMTMTLCRNIGIPIRFIYNINSAIITTYDTKYRNMLFLRDDNMYHNGTIWNYHCWNEIYINRDDIPNNTDSNGWQVINSSPLGFRINGNIGPCPVSKIYNYNKCLNNNNNYHEYGYKFYKNDLTYDNQYYPQLNDYSLENIDYSHLYNLTLIAGQTKYTVTKLKDDQLYGKNVYSRPYEINSNEAIYLSNHYF